MTHDRRRRHKRPARAVEPEYRANTNTGDATQPPVVNTIRELEGMLLPTPVNGLPLVFVTDPNIFDYYQLSLESGAAIDGLNVVRTDITTPDFSPNARWLKLNISGPAVSDVNGEAGDGSDGHVTLAADTTLTRDMFYETLVTGPFALITAGFRVFGKTSIEVSHGGSIQDNGGAGGNGASGSGGTGGAQAPFGTVAGGGVGGASGSPGVSVNNSFGGAGGNGGGSGGGMGGSSTPPGPTLGSVRSLPQSVLGVLNGGGVSIFLSGGAGGGGGASDGSNTGGGGGGGAGVLVVSTSKLVLHGTIQAKGGDGGSATTGNASGGGGGGGGDILLTYGTKTGHGHIQVRGGKGGNAAGTGAAGSPGSAGTVVQVLNQ